MSLAKATLDTPAAVLDTNAVLDWLVFADPGALPLAAAVQAGAVRWLACSAMRDELARLLAHDKLARWQPDRNGALALFDRWAQLCGAPAAVPTLHCRDADDQVFVDLALARNARWLITHDRALLALAKPARRHGLTIIQPARWTIDANMACVSPTALATARPTPQPAPPPTPRG